MRPVVLVLCAACGSHEVDLGDGNADVAIPCSGPVTLLATGATIPRLAVAGTDGHLVIGWTNDDATVSIARVELSSPDHIASVTREELPGSYTGVSIATGAHTLIALGEQNGHTSLRVDDAAPSETTVQMLAPGAAATSGDGFLLTGNDSAAGSAATVAIDTTGIAGTPQGFGAIAARLTLAGSAVVEVLSSNTCELLAPGAAAVTFGAKQKCTQAAGTGSLLAFRDSGTGGISATTNPPGAVHAIEVKSGTGASEPRISGSWVSYVTTNDELWAARLDTSGAPVAMKNGLYSMVRDASGHGVVTLGNQTYLVWMLDELMMTRLCE